MESGWLDWARKLQAIAQNGLTYGRDPYDVERFKSVRDIASQMMAVHADADPAYVRDLFASEIGHATPKVDVRGVVFQDDSMLLVRERSDGGWTLPGGWADVGESPAEAVVREIDEESGYRTRAVKLLAVFDRDRHPHTPLPYYVYKLFFRCELISGHPPATEARHGGAYDETIGVGFFRADELPPLSTGRVTPAQIQRFFDHYHHPHWPADFD